MFKKKRLTRDCKAVKALNELQKANVFCHIKKTHKEAQCMNKSMQIFCNQQI